jgi:hypothetical protein
LEAAAFLFNERAQTMFGNATLQRNNATVRNLKVLVVNAGRRELGGGRLVAVLRAARVGAIGLALVSGQAVGARAAACESQNHPGRDAACAAQATLRDDANRAGQDTDQPAMSDPFVSPGFGWG